MKQSALARLSALLLGSTILGVPAWAQDVASDATTLRPIIVIGENGEGFDGVFGGEGDIGKTVLNEEALKILGGATGDANAVLKALPNVQYADHTNTKAGMTPESVVDLRPQQFSISGGDFNSNNFVLDGVGINAVGSGTEQSTSTLTDRFYPAFDSLYSLHPQTIYVPAAVVEKMEVQDSNVSAEYGGFQGGVVEFQTRAPKREKWGGSVEFSGNNSDMAQFIVATPDGTNPLNRKPIDFKKYNAAASVSGPISPDLAVMFSVSNRFASTSRQRDPQYKPDQVNLKTNHTSLLAKAVLEKDWGQLTFQHMHDFYNNDWESYRTLHDGLTLVGNGTSSKVDFDRTFEQVGLFNNVNLTMHAAYNTSEKGRDEKSSTMVTSYIKKTYNGHSYLSPSLSDKCQDVAGEDQLSCSWGGMGDLLQSEKKAEAKFKAGAEVGNIKVRGGASVRFITADRHRPDDVNFFTSTKFNDAGLRSRDQSGGNFTCADPNDPLCFDNDQFTSRKTYLRAYKAQVNLFQSDIWGEFEIKTGDFTLTPGFRVNYNDYSKNIDLDPRLKAKLALFDDRVTLSAGVNRYHSNSMLAYAMADQRPDVLAYTRAVNGGVVSNAHAAGGWTAAGTYTRTQFKDANLKTPFTDELTGGVEIKDPLLDGTFRLSLLERQGQDQYSKTQDSTSKLYKLGNDASSQYRSATVEYAKEWKDLNLFQMNSFGIKTALTWSEQYRSTNGYFSAKPTDKFVWYKGRSYSIREFDVVTGNLDIPVRGSVAFHGSFFDERLKLWSNANFSLAYEGVYDTRKNSSQTNQFGAVVSHDVYDDKTLGAVVTVDVGGSYELYKKGDLGAVLDFKVDNLFSTKGNSTASNSYPFKQGRTAWLGLKASF
ncbi:TonB-dependent receptor plug domain-containing protein [Cohaesibacter gelatinilyticus]|uniref:TonB-dependent Receptor Plug Domain n=1 Tax=Cohaesibacter gelatinilyticus TaxID=372072 RepID=A0A285PDB0_9HYPH|nr:TonB-dependent receptor plug domain-containing protein [Cohaesibacter gelatinilyticus]SNZ19428.1 TonB-dependent Receptor Plug Domain [Cohaesibacter gelatinilyticus]